MRAAGLNPILAYKQGGASTPSMASPQGAMANIQYVQTPAISTANEVRKATAQITMQNAQTTKVLQEVNKVLADTQLSKQQAAKVKEEVLKTVQEIQKVKAEVGQIKTQTEINELRIEIDKLKERLDDFAPGNITKNVIRAVVENEEFPQDVVDTLLTPGRKAREYFESLQKKPNQRGRNR